MNSANDIDATATADASRDIGLLTAALLGVPKSWVYAQTHDES